MPTHFKRGKYRDEAQVIGPSLDAIERVYDVLLQLPDRDAATFFTVEEHKEAWTRGEHDMAGLHLFWDAYNWLKFFWWTTSFKTRQLADALASSYNSDNHLAWLILARSALEYAAVTRYFAMKMQPLQLQGPHFTLSAIKALEDLMLQYSHGSRFDWAALMAGDRDRLRAKYEPAGASRAINVLTALQHWARADERCSDVEVGYAMLSDFAHPNMASHSAVAEMPAKTGSQHEVQFAYHPGALRGEFLMVVSLPWVSTGLGATLEVLVSEVAPLLEKWLGYVDNKERLSIDLQN